MKIISIAPTRLSLFGGATDLPVYAEKYGGICINMAINLRQRIEIGDYTKGHYIPLGANPKFYEAFFEEFDYKPQVMKAEFGGIIESGLGSSASAAVALIGAINKIKNLGMTRNEIAEKAWDIEVNKLGLYGGRQDQYASVWGGLNRWDFGRTVVREGFEKETARGLSEHILLFHTGENRKDPKIQEELKTLTKTQKEALDGIKAIGRIAQGIIILERWKEVGDLLDRAWEFKKQSNKKMTTKKIDNLYETAMKNGAWGGKLCGSGGGGHIVFMADKPFQENLITKLEEEGAKHIDFSPDFNGLEVRRL